MSGAKRITPELLNEDGLSDAFVKGVLARPPATTLEPLHQYPKNERGIEEMKALAQTQTPDYFAEALALPDVVPSPTLLAPKQDYPKRGGLSITKKLRSLVESCPRYDEARPATLKASYSCRWDVTFPSLTEYQIKHIVRLLTEWGR